MKFPDSKLSPFGASQAPPPIESPLVRGVDPDSPHPYRQGRGAYAGCDACGGSPKNPVHLPPVDGWPR